MEPAITIWVDESTEISVNESQYNMVGYLITNSDKEEFDFLNKLKQSRKEGSRCWTTLHGCDLNEGDEKKLSLLERWICVFKNSPNVYFHIFSIKRIVSISRGTRLMSIILPSKVSFLWQIK